jgi:hypothetical protein
MLPEERRPPEPPSRNPDAPPRSEVGDLFRKAFGLGAGAELASSKPVSAPAAPSAPPSTAPEAPSASGGFKSSFGAPASAGLAKAASDAAVASEARASGPNALPLERRAIPTLERRVILDLLAFDPSVPSRLRRSTTHAPVLAVAAPPRTHQKVDAPAGEQTAEERARIDVMRVLSCGTPLGPEELNDAVEALLDDPYDFDIPLLLVEGDVKPTMDEVETLRVATELAKPLAGANKRMLSALGLANEALARTVPPLPETAATLYKQLEASTSELHLPTRHFADLVDRTLLEARSYKKRMLLGSLRIRADLTLGKLTLPIYLPEGAGSQLPLLPVFPLAALVEFRPREDATESNSAALVAFAFGRVLRARK